MADQKPRPTCSCCQKECWPMWATINNQTYCKGCYYIGCPTKPAECRRPFLDRLTEKVADALKQSGN